MQNLTVVPGHKLTDAEWKDVIQRYRQTNDESLRILSNTRRSQEGYTILIGHRRLEAAKQAGLEVLPCVVVHMTHQVQVATMLAENMQRSDLTIYEQAQGIQMMLDLGETVETVAQKTGLSQTTVRNRRKLLDLDPKAFEQSVERGGTLQDYMELDRISDPTLKNKVLQSVGTANFRQQLLEAQKQEADKAYLDEAIAALETFAVRVDACDSGLMVYQTEYAAYSKKPSRAPQTPVQPSIISWYLVTGLVYIVKRKQESRMLMQSWNVSRKTPRQSAIFKR